MILVMRRAMNPRPRVKRAHAADAHARRLALGVVPGLPINRGLAMVLVVFGAMDLRPRVQGREAIGAEPMRARVGAALGVPLPLALAIASDSLRRPHAAPVDTASTRPPNSAARVRASS